MLVFPHYLSPHTVSVLFIAAIAALLVHLLVLAEGAKRSCPQIGTIAAVVVPFTRPEELEEPALSLQVLFISTDRSACQCSIHEVISGGLKLKARTKRCEHHGLAFAHVS